MPAALASPPCCPTAARLTMGEPPLKRTSSSVRASHTRVEHPDDCDTPTASPWTYDTSMSCHSQTAPFASTTKPGFPTRATNCAPKSSRPKPDMDKRLTEGWILGLRDDAQASRHHLQVVAQEGPQLLHPGPSSYLYSPACVEGASSGVHFHELVFFFSPRTGYTTQAWAISTRT